MKHFPEEQQSSTYMQRCRVIINLQLARHSYLLYGLLAGYRCDYQSAKLPSINSKLHVHIVLLDYMQQRVASNTCRCEYIKRTV